MGGKKGVRRGINIGMEIIGAKKKVNMERRGGGGREVSIHLGREKEVGISFFFRILGGERERFFVKLRQAEGGGGKSDA